MASKNDLLGDNEEKILKRTRDTKNLNNTNNHNGEIDLPLKNQKTEQTSGAIIKALPIQMGGIEMPNDVVAHFFFHGPISGIRAGRCVSKPLQQLLMSDNFCNYWGMHFSPSTPQSEKMTPQDFIRHWSTPSFKVLSDDGFKNIWIREMSADGSIIVGNMLHEPDYKKSTAVQWIDGKIMTLPYLNNGTSTAAKGVNRDGSIIVGSAEDGANGNKSTAVQWIGGEIMPLPHLNNGISASAWHINRDGSIIVGDAYDGANGDRLHAVQWVDGEIKPLPRLNNGEYVEISGINRDGSIIVGTAEDGTNGIRAAVQWVGGEILPLPYLNNATRAEAYAESVNEDGSIIVGRENIFGKSTALLWSHGKVFSIQKLLESEGLNLGGHDLNGASVISANGLQVTGHTSCSNGETHYFKAILPSKYTR